MVMYTYVEGVHTLYMASTAVPSYGDPSPLQGISTGRYHAGILTNSEECEKAVFEAGRTSGDLNFPLPYCPELHFSEFASAMADMKNSVAVSVLAGSLCGCKCPRREPLWL